MSDQHQFPAPWRRRRVEMWLAALGMAVAFAAGFVARGLDDGEPRPGTLDPVAPLTGNAPIAPPLTPDQLGGELPAGHPPLGDSGADPGTGIDPYADTSTTTALPDAAQPGEPAGAQPLP